MAKSITFTDIPKISNPSATAVAGGSLLPNTTYYYRIYKIHQSGSPSSYGRSIISDEFSVTTDAVNKTARITFQSPKVAGQGYLIFRFTTPGQMNININAVTFWPTDNAHNSGGTVTFDDTGYAATTGNTFLEDRDNPHGRLVATGSTSSDKFTIEDLYNADIANGWGVILKLDENTYKVNTHLIMGSTEYFDAVEKTIIFADGISSPGNWTLGRVSGTNRTYAGCNIIIKSTWLTSINFKYLEAYRTSFQYVFPKNNGVDISTGLGLCDISFDGKVQDCTCDRIRTFVPTNTSIVKNCIVSRFDIAFRTSQATFDDVKCLQGSRVWQFGGSTTNVVARGVYTEGTAAILVVNGKTGSSLTIIDSIVSGSPMFGSYIDNDGFEYFDKFSYNLQVLEEDEVTPIAGATITMYDNAGQIFQVTTDSNGEITEQYITRVYGTVDTPALPSVYTYTNKYPYKLIIEKEGYETYTENFTQLLSEPIVKTVALKTAKPIRISTEGPVLALAPETGSSSLLKKL